MKLCEKFTTFYPWPNVVFSDPSPKKTHGSWILKIRIQISYNESTQSRFLGSIIHFRIFVKKRKICFWIWIFPEKRTLSMSVEQVQPNLKIVGSNPVQDWIFQAFFATSLAQLVTVLIFSTFISVSIRWYGLWGDTRIRPKLSVDRSLSKILNVLHVKCWLELSIMHAFTRGTLGVAQYRISTPKIGKYRVQRRNRN